MKNFISKINKFFNPLNIYKNLLSYKVKNIFIYSKFMWNIKFILFINYLRFIKKKKIILILREFPFVGIGDIIMMIPVLKEIKKIFSDYSIIFLASNDYGARNYDIAKRIPFFDFVLLRPLDFSLNVFLERYKNYFNLFNIIHKYDNIDFLPKIIANCIKLKISNNSSHDFQEGYKFKLKELEKALYYKKKFGDYIVFVDSAAKYKSKWPKKYWQKLIDFQSLSVILLGTMEDDKFNFKNCIDLRNKTTLHEAAAIIKESKLYVGSVSGLFWFTHIFNKTSIIINGGLENPIFTRHSKSYHFFSKINCSNCLDFFNKNQCDMKCMRIITPKMVNKKIKEILNQ